MKWISTTIKQKWLDKILSGEKTTELKTNSEFWRTRLEPLRDRHDIYINFLCGNICYKFKVNVVEFMGNYEDDDITCNIDGVEVDEWWAIQLGEQIHEPPQDVDKAQKRLF